MQTNSIVKLMLLAAGLFLLWKYVLPNMTRHGGSLSTTSTSENTSPGTNCTFEARAANDYWGSNISRFMGVIDRGAWDEFRMNIEARIARAQRKCFCNDDPCTRAKSAMAELRSLVYDWDGSVRSGGPAPSDTVQRQESINNVLNQ